MARGEAAGTTVAIEREKSFDEAVRAEAAKTVEETLERLERQVCIRVPMKDHPTGYKTNHLDVRLSSGEVETMAAIFDALRTSDARLKNGKPITSPAAAVVWLLQNAVKLKGLQASAAGAAP